MSDRFRFRAWDKINKVMIRFGQESKDEDEITCIGWAPCEEYRCISFYAHHDDLVDGNLPGSYSEKSPDAKPGNYILMQCTGVKDRNQRLFYEGDIVTIKLVHDKLEPVRHVCEIAYCYGSYRLLDHEWEQGYPFVEGQGYPLERTPSSIEIIGNKYEHPHLLRPKNER